MFVSLAFIKLLIIRQRIQVAPLPPPSTVSTIISAASSCTDLASVDSFEDFLFPTDAITNQDVVQPPFQSVLDVDSSESSAVPVMPVPLGNFIACSPLIFTKGINYSPKRFHARFPAESAVISDARVRIKNVIHIILGTGKLHTSFNSYAIEFLTELEIMLSGMGQPIEQGKFLFRAIVTPLLILANRNCVQQDWNGRFSVNYRTENPENGTLCTVLCESYLYLYDIDR